MVEQIGDTKMRKCDTNSWEIGPIWKFGFSDLESKNFPRNFYQHPAACLSRGRTSGSRIDSKTHSSQYRALQTGNEVSLTNETYLHRCTGSLLPNTTRSNNCETVTEPADNDFLQKLYRTNLRCGEINFSSFFFFPSFLGEEKLVKFSYNSRIRWLRKGIRG